MKHYWRSIPIENHNRNHICGVQQCTMYSIIILYYIKRVRRKPIIQNYCIRFPVDVVLKFCFLHCHLGIVTVHIEICFLCFIPLIVFIHILSLSISLSHNFWPFHFSWLLVSRWNFLSDFCMYCLNIIWKLVYDKLIQFRLHHILLLLQFSVLHTFWVLLSFNYYS